MIRRALAGAVAALGVSAAAGHAQRYATPAAAITPVPMASSCLPEASAAVDLGAAWLLVKAPAPARAAFERATDLDPDCALGYWGQALSRFAEAGAEVPSAVPAIEGAIARGASVPVRTVFERAALAALGRLAAREAAPGVPAAWPARAAAYREALCGEAATDRTIRLWCARALADAAITVDANTESFVDAQGFDAWKHVTELAVSGVPLDVGMAVIVLEVAPDAGVQFVTKALRAVAAANPPASWPHRLAASVATRRGDWAAAIVSGERLAAVATDRDSQEAALEVRLEALLQLGRRREAYALAGEAVRVPAGATVQECAAAARAYARVILADRRLDGRGLAALDALPIDRRVSQNWAVVFVTALDAALRAWPGGDAAQLAKARAALKTLEAEAGDDGVNEVVWAATIVEAAIAASQDEHQQMALFLTHAADLERRPDVIWAGRPLVPTGELAAELWLRTYRYDDARREARAVLAGSPYRISPYVVLARASARVDDAAATADGWRTVLTLREKADANDSLRIEAERALAR